MKRQLLLLEDVHGLGRSGELVTAKPGFVRNFLLPQKKAVVADKQTIKLQARLQEERAKRAAVDKKGAEALAAVLAELVLEIEVKVDAEAKLYGSVSQVEIVKLLAEKGHEIERRHISMGNPIKSLGKHLINLKLNEGVAATVTLEVKPEGGVIPEMISNKLKEQQARAEEAPKEEEVSAEEPKEEAS